MKIYNPNIAANKPVKIALLINTSWNVINFRKGLVNALLSKGYEVTVIAPIDKYSRLISQMGCIFCPIKINRKGLNPFVEIIVLIRLYRIFKASKVSYDAILTFTIKPNIYGSLVASLLALPIINNVAGLGITFSKNNFLTSLVSMLYKYAFRNSFKVFFQNESDRSTFINLKLVNPERTERVPGSGVNLDHFSYSPLNRNSISFMKNSIKGNNLDVNATVFRFILIARLLYNKGIEEYFKAAYSLKKKYPLVEFCILGFYDYFNPYAISQEQMNLWISEGVIIYMGETDDTRPYIKASDCIVLPSYYPEGVPKVLLEAAAIGRPIITTNSVGCREVVDDGVNGYLCKPKDYLDLEVKMERMLLLTQDDRLAMGFSSRKKVETYFDETIVIKKYLETIDDVL